MASYVASHSCTLSLYAAKHNPYVISFKLHHISTKTLFMKKIFVIILIGAVFVSCSSTKKSTTANNSSHISTETNSTADGSSYEKAIVINEKSEGPGVNAEYKWLKENYPGYVLKGQHMGYSGKKIFDIIDIKTADGESKSVYFDITNFYGKI